MLFDSGWMPVVICINADKIDPNERDTDKRKQEKMIFELISPLKVNTAALNWKEFENHFE